MKKIPLLSIVEATMILFSFAPKRTFETGATDNKIIRMGYFEYGSMCRGASEGAEKSGYVYDFMQKIASYTGWEYSYTYGTYSEVYDALKEGKIDILPYTNWNEERDKEVLFSKNALLEEEYYIATRPSDTRIVPGDPSTLNGMKIATVKGADQNSLLKQYVLDKGITATVDEETYGDPESTWDALESGVVDAAVFSNISYRSGADWNIFDSFGVKPTYIAVADGKKDLLKELDEAFDTLVKTNSAFISKIEEELYAGSPAIFHLSDKEKTWLKDHETIRIGYLENSNLTYAKENDDGTYSGFIPELINEIFKLLKINNKVQYFSYKTPADAGEDLLADRLETAYPFYPSFSYAEKKNLIVSNSFNDTSVSVVYKDDVGYSKSMKKVAVLSSSIIQYYLEENYKDTQIQIVDSVDEAVKLLNNNEVTGFVSNTDDTARIIQTYRNFSQHIFNSSCGSVFAAKTMDSKLIVMLNRGISSISESEIAALVANNTKASAINLSEYLKSHPEALVLVILGPIFIIGLIVVIIIVSRLRKKAQAASEAKTKFLFNMSHDIRTPMNAIIGYTDSAIRHQEDQNKVEENLKKIKLSSNHLLKLINDILEMSRIESGNVELAENPVDIREETEKISNMIQTLAVDKSIKFTLTTNNYSDPYVYADALHVNQILINLISNAIKYTNEGGKVDFIISQISNVIDGKVMYRFEIIDTGIGMSDEFQKHLFESFSREKTSTVSRQEGTGLGLSIVKKIVDLSGGRVYFKSKLNEGTQFTVELPFRVLDEKAIEEFEKEKAVLKDKKDGNESLEGKRILVVEDNEMNRDIAADLLQDSGCIVETAEDGLIAVNLIKEKGASYYDCILMDIQMPVMDGFEATKQIRKMYSADELPIIAVSANAFKEDKDASLAVGMNAHISKPINPKHLKDELVRINKK